MDTGYVGSCWASLVLDNGDGTWKGTSTSTVTWNAATMTYCWYRTFGAEASGTIEVADGSTLTFASDQITMGTNALGNWQRNDLTITGGTGRFTGAAGGGTIWGETADVDAVLAGADPPKTGLSLAIVVRPSATVTRP